jgi:hypothetical protein
MPLRPTFNYIIEEDEGDFHYFLFLVFLVFMDRRTLAHFHSLIEERKRRFLGSRSGWDKRRGRVFHSIGITERDILFVRIFFPLFLLAFPSREIFP